MKKFIGIRKNKQFHFIFKKSKFSGYLITKYIYNITLFLVSLMSLIFFRLLSHC